MKFHCTEPDANDRLAVLLNLAFCRYQRHGPRPKSLYRIADPYMCLRFVRSQVPNSSPASGQNLWIEPFRGDMQKPPVYDLSTV